MSSTPNFASVAIAADVVQVTTANTARDGTGTLATVTTGTASGVVIEQVTIKATGNTTAGMIRFFLSTDSGTSKRLLTEVSVPAITASSTVMSFRSEAKDLEGLVLVGTSNILYASTNNAETFNIVSQKSGL